MNETLAHATPPDQAERVRALDPSRSILVQAPAGSGKTDLLTRRFLRLLSEVDAPGQIVAITFTNAAEAEMRHRILSELEKAAARETATVAGPAQDYDPLSMNALAGRALNRSRLLGWNLIDLPAQLRISTIDAFCRELALQQPLFSGLGGGLSIGKQSADLYRRAARQTLEQIDTANAPLREAIETLLLWRDNNWREMEDLLVDMLAGRDRWMHDFVLSREPDPNDPDFAALRERLERPFARAVRAGLDAVCEKLDRLPGCCDRALELARFACTQTGGQLHREIAELAAFPAAPFNSTAEIEEAREAFTCLARMLLTDIGVFRRAIDKRHGFPADRKHEKNQMLALIAELAAIPGLESALAAVRALPPARYTDEDWQIVRACFTLLRHAAAQLQVVFAEAGAVDFVEVAQIAERVLRAEDGSPSDAALTVADGIRHLLVDEFQDTSRRQHQLLAALVAAWPERTSRTCFAVGDPMQSIYFFREADAELFPRVRAEGLEIPGAESLPLDFVGLSSNFRTAPALVEQLNDGFARIFAAPDGSGIEFSPAQPARLQTVGGHQPFALHLKFVPQGAQGRAADSADIADRESAHATQTAEIVELIRTHLGRIAELKAARDRGEDRKYRIAVLGRARSALTPVAEALRDAAIPFRAVDLEPLKDRAEVRDALSLARALLNPEDRIAWLGVLRAPWCGLALDDLYRLTNADDADLLARPVPDLLAERLPLLCDVGRRACERMLHALAAAPALRADMPMATLGTWLEQIWLRLGGADCVDATARANLDLLWRCLDALPAGEQDLLSPALHAALENLTALPDPEADSECGVQLMTIHKAKGLEFEVVIVPDLQARCGRGGIKLLSWLERGLARGLADHDDTGDITEFLVAPLQTKGEDRGQAKKWVDGIYRARESQEDRRILYVAATRAREELHLFARPVYKVEVNGARMLAEPANSLLATAWPALEQELRVRFDEWNAVQAQPSLDLAASADSNLLVMPTRSAQSSAAAPKLLRRLPADYRLGAPGIDFETWETTNPNLPAHIPQMPRAPSFRLFSGERVGDLDTQSQGIQLYTRHQGGLVSRALGSGVHALMEDLARLRLTLEWDQARAGLSRFEPRIAADMRALGVEPSQAADLAAQALRHALNASHHPIGQWILSPHADASSEVRWAGVVGGAVRTVRVDRVFRASPAPLSDEQDCWWIVDYKTAHEKDADPNALLHRLRPLFAPQIEAYAAILRNLHGNDAPICAGLYYPRMLLFDWWQL